MPRLSRLEYANAMHRNWQGQIVSQSPQAAYRKDFQAGLGETDNPRKEAWREWALGSAAFIKRTLALSASQDDQERRRMRRRLLVAVSVLGD